MERNTMAHLEVVRREIVKAALDVLGSYVRSKAEKIAD